MATTLEQLEQELFTLKTVVNTLKEMITGQQSEVTYSVSQVAKLLGLTKAGVNFHIRNGNIKTIGNKQRFKQIAESELNRYIATLTNNEAKA